MGSQRSVAIVAPSFHPMIGGVELYVKHIGAELARLGYDVHVYTPDTVLGQKMEQKEEVVEGIRVHRLPVRFELSYRVKLWRGLREAIVAGSHDIVHVYSHDAYTRAASKAAQDLKRPLLVTTYGPFETHSDYGLAQRLPLKAYDAFVTPALMRRCARVMVRYPEISGWVTSFGVDESCVKLEPSGIPRSYLALANGRKFREETGHDGELILYLGRISPQKGVQYAVMAMEHVRKRFPNAKLVIAGPDYIDYSSKLRELAERHGVADGVVTVGPVTDPEREGQILSSCDVFVMPSSFEGFSQGVMKAMAQGKPVVVSDVGGLPFEVDYGRCGLVTPFGDARLLADRLVEILESRQVASQMGTSGRRRAEEFTFDRLAANLSQTYESAVSAPPSTLALQRS